MRFLCLGIKKARAGHPSWLQFRVIGVCLALLLVCLPAGAASEEALPPLPEPVASDALTPDYLVDFWRNGQGLPHNTVNALLQTREGYLWVGTAAGLARFDGLTFSLIGDETAPGLKDASITALLEDRGGALWVGTQGRGVFQLQHGHVSRFTVSQGLADNSVTSLAEDAAGRLWIGTQAGLNCWTNGRLEPFVSPAVRAGDGIVALHAGRSGTLWITTRSGVFHLKQGQVAPFEPDGLPQGRNAEFIGAYEDSSGNLWAFGSTFLLNVTQGRRFNYFRPQELASSRVWTICEQSDGTFWIGTSGRGLFRFQNGRFRATGIRQGLEQCDVRALYADRLGNLWLGTSGQGLARLHASGSGFISAGQGLNSRKVTAIAPDALGGLWVGTADSGLLHWDGRRIAPFTGGAPLDRITQIQSLCRGRQGSLWVGTWGAGLWQLNGQRQRRFTTAEGLSDDIVLAVAADPENDTLWVGTQSGNLHRLRAGKLEVLSAEKVLEGSAILSLLPRTNGTVLCGTESGTLLRWNGKTLGAIPAPAELAGKPVRSLFTDRRGRLWVGSWGAGAFCRRGEQWVGLSKRQGLGSDLIGQITQDDAGDFWFGAADSLFKVRSPEIEGFLRAGRQTVASMSVMVEQDVEDSKCAAGWPGVARASNGALWLATSGGLLPLTAGVRALAEPPPPVILERVLVNGQPRPVDPAAPLRLGSSARSLEFAFTAVSFTAPQKVRFRYKLENFDADWAQGNVGRLAHYGPLPPGRYEFRVLACNADGVWNPVGASQPLIVVPPVWRSWWFLSLSGAAAVAAVWAAARLISTRRLRRRLRLTQQQHAMDRERARIAQDMHDEIGSKLTRISFLSEVARQAGANAPAAATPPVEAIASTSRELLQALDEIVWAVNPRNDNLEHLAGYLEQHAHEYFQSTAVRCEVQLPAQLPGVSLSAELRHNVFLAFQEALNNTLKHAQATQVNVQMSLGPEHFEVSVQDNGKGFAAEAATQPEQDGLQNMQARLRSVGGTFDISSHPGGGTTVRLSFPLSKEE